MFYRYLLVISFFVGVVARESQSNDRESKNDQFVQRSRRQDKFSQTSVSTTLADSDDCKSDVKRYCTKGASQSIGNIKVLECFDELDNAVNLISKECQTCIYNYKYNMTHNVRFDDAANRFCAKDIKLLEECNEEKNDRGTGHLISCLYDRLPNITEPDCRKFINRIQAIVFTDWRLSESFATACLNDITNLTCGRLDDENGTLPHEQGAVLSCLSKSHKILSKPCLKHISRLTEMQSDDYHLDRALYLACREDRERLCPQVASGNGRVYRCLYEQKFNTMMSTPCRKEVHRRQSMIASNILLDAPLLRVCRTEMREHHCGANPDDPDKQLTLVNLLLCLENKIKKGNQIKDECQREMLVHRRMLMSDFALSPEIISHCQNEMLDHCPSLYQKGASGSIDQRGGRMVHCLMKAAQKEKDFSHSCLSNIKSLVRAVNPGNDIRADPLLETACRPVIDALCQKIKPGDSSIIMCLLDNLKHTRMTDDCEDRLMEVAYFMARDLRLTPGLLRSCQKNLIDICSFPQNWTMTSKMSNASVGNYLSCLYRQRQQLQSDCRNELQRLMRIRSQSIGLMPEIEDNCMEDLATCKNPEVKGEEMKCLQKKYKKLEPQCKAAVRNYTEMTMSDSTVDFLLLKACEPMIQLFCPNTGAGKENEIILCLIKNKNNPTMNIRCKAGIEHHQIVSLKDSAFLSETFKKKCNQEITDHCSKKTTKASTVQCLANLVLQDTIQKKDRIKDECRDELKFELLQRSENINLDPLLLNVCRKDIQQFCRLKTAGNAQILDCLKANHNKVSPLCYARLKTREKLDVVLPGNDFSLTTKCASMIQKYCANEKKQKVLLCLRQHVNEDSMTISCRQILYHRLMVLNTDARFNKGLIDSCKNDINKHCSGVVVDKIEANDDDDESDDEDDDNADNEVVTNDDEFQDRDMGGRVIECLRSKYANTAIQLEPQCTIEITDVIQASKLDIQFDVKLYQKCKTILGNFCRSTDKEDCLKLLFQQNKLTDQGCKEQVIRIIKEGKADVHADSALTVTCQADILKFCNDIPIGSGKHLQCLLKNKKTLSKSCQQMLTKRQELWSTISDVDDIDDLRRHIMYSKNNKYLYTVIASILLAIFLAGYICRPCMRYRRVSKYK